MKATYVSHRILVKEQPNKINNPSLLEKLKKQSLDFLDDNEKREFKEKSTAIGVRG